MLKCTPIPTPTSSLLLSSDDWMHKLAEKYTFETWEKYDADHTVIRFCTSWATKDENIAALVHDIAAL